MDLFEGFSPLLIITCISLYFIYRYSVKFSYWTERGVPCQTALRALKRAARLMLTIDSFTISYYDVYKEFNGHRYGGTFDLTSPELLLRDPELIKAILIKGFTSFTDRVVAPNPKLDPISTHLFTLQGEKWRRVRHKMSTAFSSAKLKALFHGLKECAQEMDDYLKKKAGSTGTFEFEAQELTSNYTLDVMGFCAMGVKCNSFHEEDSELKKNIRIFFRFDIRRIIHRILELVHPKLPTLLGWTLRRPEVVKFFVDTCKATAALKESEAATRKDFLQILIDVQKSEKKEIESNADPSQNSDMLFTDNLMAGIIASFFSAGFDPTAAALTFCLYELALNPEVQEKLFTEIQNVSRKVGGEVEYETLNEFKYVDLVLDETLRKYPAAGTLSRICTERFQLPDTPVVVEKDVNIKISVFGLHMDAQYFPDPEKFDPDRFSEENKDNIVPGTYLPFGEGPRTCIAKRLALIVLKTMLIKIVSKYSIQPTAKTPKKLKFSTRSLTLGPAEKMWLCLCRRV